MKKYLILLCFCASSCVEEGSSENSSGEKERDSKFLIPTKSQSSQQLKEHKSSDKMLVPREKDN